MTEDQLIKAMMQARESRLILLPAGNGRGERSVTVRRPDEAGMVRLKNAPTLDIARECVVDWHGWTDADLLPEGVGGSDARPFSKAVWAVYIGDHLEHAAQIETYVIDLIAAYFSTKESAEKN
jgi:hypothetical protein